MDSAPTISPTLEYSGDMRHLILGNRTFILQLAHPSVGAGVMQFSKFREDPWSRLKEIAYSGNQMMYHGHDAAMAEGKRLRELHRGIKGIDSRGKRYHALNPEVYGWVHYVFFESTLATHTLFGTPASPEMEDLLFEEWKQSAAFFGLRERDLPTTKAAYWEKWHHMMETTLEYNDAIDYVLHLDRHTPPAPPALAKIPEKMWQHLWRPIGKHSHLMTTGSLPEAYRSKFGSEIPWNRPHQKQFETHRKRIKRLFSLLPKQWRLMPQARQMMRKPVIDT